MAGLWCLLRPATFLDGGASSVNAKGVALVAVRCVSGDLRNRLQSSTTQDLGLTSSWRRRRLGGSRVRVYFITPNMLADVVEDRVHQCLDMYETLDRLTRLE